jgi:hypothetical protein
MEENQRLPRLKVKSRGMNWLFPKKTKGETS